MKTKLLSEVREKCRLVAQQATFVRIAEARIPPYAESLPLDLAIKAELDPQSHFVGQGEETLSFLIALDAINFGSGYFPHLHKRANKSGYFTIAAGLTDHYREEGPLSARQLASITPSDCARIFDQTPDNQPIAELMRLFATAWNDLGGWLLQRFDGSFNGVIESAAGSAEQLVIKLGEMPFYQDVLPYSGMRVPFYKRAQLTAADLSLAFQGEGYGRFDDLSELTIFADNLVPHVLRVDGLLIYDGDLAGRIDSGEAHDVGEGRGGRNSGRPFGLCAHPGRDLAGRIDSGEPIPAGSHEEVELRACALHAVELMAAALRQAGRPVTAMQLDYLLWNRGQQPFYKKIHPRHRTRTVFY